MKISRILFVVATAGAVVVSSASAQTTVTPTNPNGWEFFDAKNCDPGPVTPSCIGPDPSVITSTQPFNGNGSIQFTVDNSTEQPAAAYLLPTPVTVGSLGAGFSLGFSYLDPALSSATIRLLLTNVGDGLATPTFGSLGYYSNTLNSSFTTESFSTTVGGFFFRVGGLHGESDPTCTSVNTNFDGDRRNTIASYIANCNGAPGSGKYNIDDAIIYGVEIDYGTFVSPSTITTFADGVNFAIGPNTGNFNFELDAGSPSAVTPEPATMTMMGLGLVGLMGVRRRKRSA